MPEMKRITFVDDDGYERAVLLPYGAPNEAVEFGVPSEPPNLDRVDWDGVKRDLHNALMAENILTWEDVQAGQNRVSAICRRVFARRVLELYRTPEVGK
jgi:hypothetical protein